MVQSIRFSTCPSCFICSVRRWGVGEQDAHLPKNEGHGPRSSSAGHDPDLGLNLLLSEEAVWWLPHILTEILEKTATIDGMKAFCFVAVVALLFIDWILISKILASPDMDKWKLAAIFSNIRQYNWLLSFSPYCQSLAVFAGVRRSRLAEVRERFRQRHRSRREGTSPNRSLIFLSTYVFSDELEMWYKIWVSAPKSGFFKDKKSCW